MLELKEDVVFCNKEWIVPFSSREVELEVFVPFRATIKVVWTGRSTCGYLTSSVVLPPSVTANETEVVVDTAEDDYGPVFLTSKQRVSVVVGDEGDNVLIELRADDRQIFGL